MIFNTSGGTMVLSALVGTKFLGHRLLGKSVIVRMFNLFRVNVQLGSRHSVMKLSIYLLIQTKMMCSLPFRPCLCRFDTCFLISWVKLSVIRQDQIPSFGLRDWCEILFPRMGHRKWNFDLILFFKFSPCFREYVRGSLLIEEPKFTRRCKIISAGVVEGKN